MSESNPIRQKFQAAVEQRDSKVAKIDSGELGVDLWCKILRAKDQSTFSARAANKDTGEKVRSNYAAEYLSICLCDEKGALLFPGEFGVIDLQGMPAQLLGPILDECHRVNGEKKEALRKNSETTGDADSSSASPGT